MRGEKGSALIETLIGVVIFGLIAVAVLSSLILAGKSNITSDEQTTAESLARTQMEYVQQQAYSPVYSLSPSLNSPADYSISTAAAYLDPNILQKIVITIQRNAKTVYTLEGYKVKR